MNTETAAKIIGCLKEGLNPLTGDKLPREELYNHPDIIRALYKAYELLNEKFRTEEKKKKKSENRPAMHGQKWFPAEDDRLSEEFKAGLGLRDIAEKHKRSVFAIEKRREKLNEPEVKRSDTNETV